MAQLALAGVEEQLLEPEAAGFPVVGGARFASSCP